MAVNVEELRKEMERVERERAEIERRLQEAERAERAKQAAELVGELRKLTERIDQAKEERQQLLWKMRQAAPLLGDYTYGQEDYKLTVQAARATLKQPELLDKLVKALTEADVHLEPRAKGFRLFKGLRPLGTLAVSTRRLTVQVTRPIFDQQLVETARALDAQFPGLAQVELASAKKERRVKADAPGCPPNGDYAVSLTVAASDTGSLDAVLPLALRALAQAYDFAERYVTDADENRLFEPWPQEGAPAAAPEAAPVAAPVVEAAPVAVPVVEAAPVAAETSAA